MKKWGAYIALFISIHVCAQTPLEQFLAQPAIQYANVSVLVTRLSNGEIIDSYRAQNTVAPASVIKLLTTATALEHWGSDHRFETQLCYSGSISQGVLHGNLYIVGKGDPTLGGQEWGGNAFLTNWVAAIRKAGIQRIEGGVIADVSYYDGDALNPGWLYEDAGNYYAPGTFAIAYLDNTLHIQLKSGAIGTTASVVKTTPNVPGLTFENHIRCSSITYDGAYVHGLPYQNCRYLTGSIPSNKGTFGVRGDLPNPGLMLAQHLTGHLRQSKIDVRDNAGYIAEADGVQRKIIYTHYSPSLASIVEKTNQQSINLNAEMLFRNLGAEQSAPGTIHQSADFIQQFWRNRGVNIYSARILDGCGLSPQNGISAESLVSLIRYMLNSKENNAFVQSLPASGQTGTLKQFLVGTELEGKVQAKSGTIKGTKNYAGLMDLNNNEQLVFAIMVNGSSSSNKQIQHAIETYLIHVYRATK